MARIIYSGLATEIRGSIGGTTFQKNAYGFTIKNKPNMIKPESPGQDVQKRFLLLMLQTWQAMSGTERTNWSTFANTYPQYSKNNPTSQLDGYGVFLRYNMQQQIFNTFVQTDPGIHSQILVPPTIEIKSNGTEMAYTMTAPTPNLLINYNAYISRVVTQSTNYISTRTRYMWSDVVRNRTDDIQAKYANTFGRVAVEGEKLFVRLVFFEGTGAFVFAPFNIPVIVESL